MKFKVGDKVRVISARNEECGYEELVGNIYTVESIGTESDTGLKYVSLEETGYVPYLFNCELVNKKQFTKSDLKDGDIVTYRNGDKRTVIAGNLINSNGYISKKLNQYTNELKDTVIGESLDIIKVERPVKYETVFEREEVLDEVEKKYLANVIKPFRHKIKSIMKRSEYGTFVVEKKDNSIMLILITGGWSENEEIINIISNTMFWFLWWQESKRGGYYRLEIVNKIKYERSE